MAESRVIYVDTGVTQGEAATAVKADATSVTADSDAYTADYVSSGASGGGRIIYVGGASRAGS